MYHSALARIRNGRADEALAHSRSLLSSHPDWPGSHAIHGEALLSLGDYQGALKEFEWLIERSDTDPLARIKRGLALAALGDFEAAQAAFDAARRVNPEFVASFLRELSGTTGAPASLDPLNIYLWRQYIAQRDCDWRTLDRYVEEFRRAISIPDCALERALVFPALHLPLDLRERHRLAKRVAQEVEQAVAPLPELPAMGGKRRLRIGVLSPGFREHIDALLLLPLLELIDRKRFEVYAYSTAADDGSAVRRRIQRASAQFRDLTRIGDSAAALQLRRDRLDILVDAAGHTEGARFGIVAARPAPLQVLYLGFTSTMGSNRIDYAILDPVVAPPEHWKHWSEKVIHLPQTYFLYDFREQPPKAQAARSDYGLPQNAPVLCAFHKAEKIDPDSFSLWCEILRETPGAVLWLLGERAQLRANLRAAAAARHVDPERLVFCQREDRERYLRRLRLADLYLDAVHHNAIVTACDCLAMGLPVLSLRGTNCSSMSAESILGAAGLSDMVASDRASYVEKALSLVKSKEAVNALRHRVLALRASAPLYDTAGRVRQLECAFEEMWRRKVSGLPNEPFAVSERRDV